MTAGFSPLCAPAMARIANLQINPFQAAFRRRLEQKTVNADGFIGEWGAALRGFFLNAPELRNARRDISLHPANGLQGCRCSRLDGNCGEHAW